ncbi:hypothetical protein BTN50_1923 [Candidatus Enterovibrio altilux]|uniref:Uncharacterized protein n=1 Tax=Candidatus Enterovibrio altilux TaxID=1927128 RepID=A0A291BBC9_9GAMM|nr:hypothetical protein BTN50_1923 [Candidatus Enterovibrio luxaltus]
MQMQVGTPETYHLCGTSKNLQIVKKLPVKNDVVTSLK